MNEPERIRYEEPAPAVARVVLTRPEMRNAQDKQMLYELNAAFDRAMADDAVKVIVLAAEGPDFSSGHDTRDPTPMADFTPVTQWGGFGLPGVEGRYSTEQELYLGLSWRWRNLPKVTIAQVQGRVIAGGLMLVWPCDLIVAAEDASFADPVVAFGVNGHEFFVHPWEVGARRAKEMLFTGEPITAADAQLLGMVNHVVPRDELEPFTLELASHIATRPGFGLKLAKQAVNQALDAQGQWTAVQAALALHHLGHAHHMEIDGIPANPSAVEMIKAQTRRQTGTAESSGPSR